MGGTSGLPKPSKKFGWGEARLRMNPLLGKSYKTLNLLHFHSFELQTGLFAAPAPEGRVLGGVMEANLQNILGGVGPTPPQNKLKRKRLQVQ